MAEKNGGTPIAVIVGVAVVAVLFKTCQNDPGMRSQVIGAAKSGIDFFAALIGTVLVVFGGGGAVLLLKEALRSRSPIEEWGWRFALAAAVGVFGLWVIGHAS